MVLYRHVSTSIGVRACMLPAPGLGPYLWIGGCGTVIGGLQLTYMHPHYNPPQPENHA